MGVADVAQLATQLGGMGGLVVYLIWSEQRRDKQRASERAREQDLEEKDIASREKLASSLTALSMVIQGRADV
jgi:hypothetical protein